MKLKKINAVLSLLTTLTLLIHLGYTIYAYLAFYYNPDLKLLTAMPFMVLACLHAVCGMTAVFLQSDGSSLNLYPKQNLRTVLQRMSAALILPLLILHLNTFHLLQTCAEGGLWVWFYLLILSQPLFYATVLTHTALSLTRALITLGWLGSRDQQRILDRIVYSAFAIIFALAVYAVVKTEIVMFAGGAG